MSPRRTGRVYAPRVRGWPARSHTGRGAAGPRGRRDGDSAACGAARRRGGYAISLTDAKPQRAMPILLTCLVWGFLQGEARTEFHALREEIVGCLALVEALIDFGEGEDIEEGVFEDGPFVPPLHVRVIFDELCTARRRVQRLRDRIQSILADNRRGEIMRAGIRLAIFGPPNVGKSSLLNFLGTVRSHRYRPLRTDGRGGQLSATPQSLPTSRAQRATCWSSR